MRWGSLCFILSWRAAPFPPRAGCSAPALLLRALLGVGLAGTYMPGVRLVAETFPRRRRGAALGVFIACFSIGAALSLFLAGRLLPLGIRTMFLLMAVGPLLGVVLAWAVVHDVPRATTGVPRPRGLPLRDVLRNPAALRFIGGGNADNKGALCRRGA